MAGDKFVADKVPGQPVDILPEVVYCDGIVGYDLIADSIIAHFCVIMADRLLIQSLGLCGRSSSRVVLEAPPFVGYSLARGGLFWHESAELASR